MTGIAAAICLGFSSCSKFDFTPITHGEEVYESYETAFVNKFGEPAPEQTWGFGTSTSTRAALTRSISAPSVAEVSAPYDAAWVANYLATATEVNNTNAWDNYDNRYWVDGTPAAPGTPAKLSFDSNVSAVNACMYNLDNIYVSAEGNGYTSDENKAFWREWCKPYNDGDYSKYGTDNIDDAVPVLKKKLDDTNRSDWYNYTPATEGTPATDGYWVYDTDFVLNFKITGTWNGSINVVATEGYYDNGDRSYNERTVVVTGTWNLSWTEQRVGGRGRIIVANGGTLNVGDGANLNSVNEAQIVVLPGGKITGNGTVAFNNGTSAELVSYNGGEINVGTFNNNGGDFYNYGTLKATSLLGGAGKSCYYNHNLISIQNTGAYDSSSSNTRIYNRCQFYCSGNMRIRNYEGIQGSALICDGELMLSGSEDGTTDASYVGLQAGALVKCGTLYNNGTSWSGPTHSGYAVLDIEDKITYLNWEQDAPQNGGYFANNIYVYAGTWANTPGGNGWASWDAETKFNVVRNATGNGNVTIIEKSNDDKDELIPADSDFSAGVSGCTPGFKGKTPDPDPEPDPEPEAIRVIAEDLSASEGSDFDFNDVVFDVQLNYPADNQHTITLLAAGGTLPLTVGGMEYEVHDLFGVSTSTMVNTNNGTAVRQPVKYVITGNYSNAKDIEVRVKKGSEWLLLTAEQGKAASKIGVPTTYQWCDEWQDIEDRYPKFKEYVSDPSVEWWK